MVSHHTCLRTQKIEKGGRGKGSICCWFGASSKTRLAPVPRFHFILEFQAWHFKLHKKHDTYAKAEAIWGHRSKGQHHFSKQDGSLLKQQCHLLLALASNESKLLFILSTLIKPYPHHFGISYYVNFLGRLGSNGFQLK